MEYYTIVIMIILPFCSCLVINLMVVMFVRSSTRRVTIELELSPQANRAERGRMTRRDLHLFKHLMLMLWIFLLGWAPIYLLPVFLDPTRIDPLMVRLFTLLTELSICSQMIDLFIYNHQLRKYLRTVLRRIFTFRQ